MRRSLSAPASRRRRLESRPFAAGATAGSLSPRTMAEPVQYVYAVVDANASLAGVPEGIDDSAIEVERDGDLAALVSVLDGSVYAGSEVEGRSGDIDWLGPRARAHDRIVTWASDRGAAVP